MSSKAKQWLLLAGAAFLAGGAVVFAVLQSLIPAHKREGAEELKKALETKAEGMRTAAGIVEAHTQKQVEKVEQQAEAEKKEDPVAFANEFIAGRKP